MMPRIQALCVRASLTFLLPRRQGCTAANRSGAQLAMLMPLSQVFDQNMVEQPSPTEQIIEALKKVMVTVSSVNGRAAQGLVGSAHLSQSHRNRCTRPMRSMSGMPRPPKRRSVGHNTMRPDICHHSPSQLRAKGKL
jgi:hypothetical protein